MKKHNLKEHFDDVLKWDGDSGVFFSAWKHGSQTLFFVAYERWLNDRVLLTEEDQTAPRPEAAQTP